MGLLDGIERLINEHGSAAILKERIELANDKYSSLEDKNSILEQKVTMLEAENKTLRLNFEKAEIEVQNLKKITEKSHSDRLIEVKEKILVLLTEQDRTPEPSIAQTIGISPQLAKFHLEELKASKLINVMVTMSAFGNAPPATWYIQQEGRSYLVTHGLLA